MGAFLLGMYLKEESLGPGIGLCSAVAEGGSALVIHLVESVTHHFTGEGIEAHRIHNQQASVALELVSK